MLDLAAGDLDFGRTHLYFSTDHSRHTPRLRIDGVCRVTPPGSAAVDFFLTCACIAEQMYVERDLIHDPVAEFNLIAQERGQIKMLKRCADARHDVISLRRFGEVLPTHDGQGSRIQRLDVTKVHHRRMTPLTDTASFRAALLGNQLINAHTRFTDPATGFAIEMLYPAATVNVRNAEEGWQVDAGPVLMPLARQPEGELVEHLDLAYVVYNRFDYMEAVLREQVVLDPATNLRTSHLHQRRALSCEHRLWAAVE